MKLSRLNYQHQHFFDGKFKKRKQNVNYESLAAFQQETSNHSAENYVSCNTNGKRKLMITLCRNQIIYSVDEINLLSDSESILDKFRNCGVVFCS